MWESLEMSLPFKLQMCSDTIPVMHNWWSSASISVHNILWKKQGVRFWGTWKGCTDHPPVVVWHSRENMEEQIQVHWSPMFSHTDSRNHECLNDIPERLWVSYPCWDGLQLLCDWVCAFQKPTHSIRRNAKMMGSYFYIILTAERVKKTNMGPIC